MNVLSDPLTMNIKHCVCFCDISINMIDRFSTSCLFVANISELDSVNDRCTTVYIYTYYILFS